jgi:hypothetical protein
MTASEKEFPLARAESMYRRRAGRQIPVICVAFVLSAMMGAAQAGASTHETDCPPKAQNTATLDQMLDNITGSDLNHKGLDQSNLAIDQLVQRADKLTSKATRERNKEIKRGDLHSPLGQVLDQAVLMLSDSSSYLLKLKELQNALIAAQAAHDGPKVDAHETCKSLNREFKAIWTDLRNLKLGVKKLPFRQRAIADVIEWDVVSRLDSAIHRIQTRTLQVGTALTLDSELHLESR